MSETPRIGATLRRAWERIHTKRELLKPHRFEDAIQATRTRAFSDALLVFMFGLSIDDLHVLRVPAWMIGVAAAFLIIVAGPLVYGRRLATANRLEDSSSYRVRVGNARRRGMLRLVIVLFAFAAWLVVFSGGVPPWAAQ